MLWYSAASCKVSQFIAFFLGTTGLILINLWFLFMLWHSAANCKVSKFSHFFAFFWRTTGLHQTLIFVHAVAFCSHLQCFIFSFTFLHFSKELLVFIKHWFLFMLWHSAANCKVSQNFSVLALFSGILVWFWSNFDFCLCCATLQPIVKFQIFLTFLHFSEELLVFIKHWFLFMLWHSAATCNVSIFPSLFCIFLKNYWSSSNIDFCSCCGILQPIAKFHKFSQFRHFSQELLVWSSSNFDFRSCCGTLQPVAKFLTFLHFSQELLVWSWSIFDFCSCCGIVQLIVKFQNFLSFLHFSQELLVWFWSNFDFCSCCGTLQPLAMFPNFLHFFAFF